MHDATGDATPLPEGFRYELTPLTFGRFRLIVTDGQSYQDYW